MECSIKYTSLNRTNLKHFIEKERKHVVKMKAKNLSIPSPKKTKKKHEKETKAKLKFMPMCMLRTYLNIKHIYT